eukprot:jgi/Mesvir1/10693/Mv13783-RA.1
MSTARSQLARLAVALLCVLFHAHISPAVSQPPFSTKWVHSWSGREADLKYSPSEDAMVWKTKAPGMIVTHIAPQRLSEVHDRVTLKLTWSSTGAPSCEEMTGAGDFRIGLFDTVTDSKQASKLENGFAPAEDMGAMTESMGRPPLSTWRGYHFRIFPHVDEGTQALRGGFYRKISDTLFDDYRLATRANGCFGLPLGAPAPMELTIERLGDALFSLRMSLGETSYEYRDDWLDVDGAALAQEIKAFSRTLLKSEREALVELHTPQYISTVAILYPEERGYESVTLSYAGPGARKPDPAPVRQALSASDAVAMRTQLDKLKKAMELIKSGAATSSSSSATQSGGGATPRPAVVVAPHPLAVASASAVPTLGGPQNYGTSPSTGLPGVGHMLQRWKELANARKAESQGRGPTSQWGGEAEAAAAAAAVLAARRQGPDREEVEREQRMAAARDAAVLAQAERARQVMLGRQQVKSEFAAKQVVQQREADAKEREQPRREREQTEEERSQGQGGQEPRKVPQVRDAPSTAASSGAATPASDRRASMETEVVFGGAGGSERVDDVAFPPTVSPYGPLLKTAPARSTPTWGKPVSGVPGESANVVAVVRKPAPGAAAATPGGGAAAAWTPAGPSRAGSGSGASAVPAGGLLRQPPFMSTWYKSRSGVNLRHDHVDDSMTWYDPTHPDMVLTHFAPERLSVVGDSVTLGFRWKSSGGNSCPAELYSGPGKFCMGAFPCAHSSVSCMAGTGDFRIGLFDTTSNKVAPISGDGFAQTTDYRSMERILADEPFRSYRGYHFRVYPHLGIQLRAYQDPKSGNHIPCGFYRKASGKLYDPSRVNRDGNGCFASPLGQWRTLKLGIKRTGKTRFRLSMEMNGYLYEVDDDWNSISHLSNGVEVGKRGGPSRASFINANIPNWIDTVAIQYPNGRNYHYITWTYPNNPKATNGPVLPDDELASNLALPKLGVAQKPSPAPAQRPRTRHSNAAARSTTRRPARPAGRG